jgi:hypothetical protein
MTAAEKLRRAAEVIRARAEAARKGRWVADGTEVLAKWKYDNRPVASTAAGSPVPEGQVANAMFIATFDPTVALAVADWLDLAARMTECEQASDHQFDRPWSASRSTNAALAVADAILAGVEG